MTPPALLSVNVGRPETLPGRRGRTGIFKRPVETATIGPLGIEGDAVLDRKHHGGPDQAVYLYFADDYRWWSDELGEPIVPGTFGENLTIEGIEGVAVCIGDRFAIGPLLLEATLHRKPCATLAARMGDATFVKRFTQAGRPGAYCRVLEPGTVQPGVAVIHTPFAGERVTVADLMALEGARHVDAGTMHRVLRTPAHLKLRADYEARLEAGAAP